MATQNQTSVGSGKDVAQWNADKLQGIAISASAPSDGDVLTYDDGTASLVYSAGGGGYTDEQAQDAVAGILDDGTIGDITFVYLDDGAGSPNISGVIDNESVNAPKIYISETKRVLGRTSAGDGEAEEIAIGTTAGTVAAGDHTHSTYAPLSNTNRFRAYRNTGSAYTHGNSGTYQDFIFNDESDDPDGKFNTSTGQYTAPVSGFYMMTARVAFDTSTPVNTLGNIALYNYSAPATVAIGSRVVAGNGTGLGLVVTDIVELAANDVVGCKVYQASGGTVGYVEGAVECYFAGYLVSTLGI